jgi:D-lactate dehydrogenase
MTIAFFSLREAFRERIEANTPFGSEHDVQFYNHILDADHLPEDTSAEVVSVFVDSHVDQAVIEAFPNLKHIATRSTGFDHIDLAACEARGITVSNVPTYGDNTVAEHAFALLLSLSKRIVDGYEQLRARSDFNPHALEGFDLKGNIGRYSIRMGNGFSMNVIAYDAFPKPELASELGFSYVDSLDTLLAESDVITVHVPHLPATHHMINRENIGTIKKGAVLINTSRGPVVETEALLAALTDGTLAGAGLDVVEEEDVMKDAVGALADNDTTAAELQTALINHKLIDLPNVIMTPHSAFNTREALGRILETTMGNISGHIDATPQNLVEAKK